MKKMIKDHMKKIKKEQISYEKYLKTHQAESETIIYASMQLAIEWCKVKYAIWSAILKEQGNNL